jgi:hypothetical protein
MPAGAVYVGRPSRWANQWRITKRPGPAAWERQFVVSHADSGEILGAFWHGEQARKWAVKAFRRDITDELITAARANLAGRDLACWCPLDQPCHVDVLLELANA